MIPVITIIAQSMRATLMTTNTAPPKISFEI